MRTALIGCGQVMEEGHLPMLRGFPGIEVVALVDVALGRAHALVGLEPRLRSAAIYATPAAMLAEQHIDAAIVATPPAFRLGTVAPLSEAGVAVLAEKPVAATLKDADSLVALSERTDSVIMLCHNYAFFEEYRIIAAILAAGTIGRVEALSIQALGSYGWPGVPEFRPGWRCEAEVSGGGRLLDTGWHALYLAEQFAGGRFTQVTADADFEPAPPVDRRSFAIYRRDDVVVTLAVGEGQGPVAFEVFGRAGRIRLNFGDERGDFGKPPHTVEVFRDETLIGAHPVPARGMVTSAMYEEWIRRIGSGDRPYAHSAAHGRDVLDLAVTTYRAAITGQRQRIGAAGAVNRLRGSGAAR